MPNYDLTNLALQIAAPANELLYDDLGDPSVMVRIPKFKISDVIDGGGSGTHPAFIVNGVEKESIYISKYQNIVNNGRAYSLPMQDPAVYVNYDQAWQYCKAKGAGWHLMTNAEWAAVALWCKKNGFMPKGNNNYGKDIADGALPQKALPTYYSGSAICRVATGSGPLSWYHDNTEAGIADLNGNVWEWVSGYRVNVDEINILVNNDAADWNNPVNATSAEWKAIMPDGTLVAPGTAGTLKFATAYGGTPFASIVTSPAATGAGIELLEALGIIPHAGATASDYGNDAVWMNITTETLPLRGGYWNDGASCGVFALALDAARTASSNNIGFRAAFCSL